MSRNWKSLGALTLAGCAVAIGAGTAAAQQILPPTTNTSQTGTYNDNGRTGSYAFTTGDWNSYYQRYETSNVWVAGADVGQDRVDCYRGNGTAQWYESTILAKNGTNASHYYCGNNSTYNQGFTTVSVDLHN